MSNTTPDTTQETEQLPSIFDACNPRQDVLIGELAEDQFAASLADVAHSTDAPEVYADPQLFFEKTYPTDGLQELLSRLTTRFVAAHDNEYSGTNGILRLDTSFGGGKTHNQIAAYHLAESPDSVPDLSDFLTDQDTADAYTNAAALGLDVNTAVFVGTHIGAQDARSNYDDPDAPATKTMWGEMAYQLFGREGYEFLRENDESRSPPGSNKLERLFERHSDPSLILIDEMAAYLEQAAALEVGDSTLAKQTNTFLMSLLSATQNTDDITVVLSIADTAFADQAEDVRGLVSEVIAESNSITDRTEGIDRDVQGGGGRMDRKQVKKDFNFLDDDRVLAVLLFGSQVTDNTHERSDIDICIVAPDMKPITIMRKIWGKLKTEKYDIHTFEEFSLKMKHQVMKDHEIIHCKDNQELEEYFYQYRKIWNDQAIARGAT